jgi:spore coat protein U-like protein
MRYHALILVATSALLLKPASASAASCAMTIEDLSFGSVDVTANVPLDAATHIQVDCSGTVGESVLACPMLSGNQIRSMRQAGSQLNYGLYVDAARTQPWGDLRSGAPLSTPIVIGPGGTIRVSVPLFARLPAQQSQAAIGNYIESIPASSLSLVIASGSSCAKGSIVASGPALTARATVVPQCSVSVRDIDFGVITSLSAPVDAVGEVSLLCTREADYQIALDPGRGGATLPEQRQMKGPEGKTLAYGLYLDSSRQQPWGWSADNGKNGKGAGERQSLAVYGRVHPQTTPPAGSYRDTVVVTVTY